MSNKRKESRPRITSWIRTNFGEEILAEIVSGKRKISLNGVKLNAKADNFRDKRVTKTSQVEITPEPKVLYQDTDSKIIETLTPKKSKTLTVPATKFKVRDRLTETQIDAVNRGKANVFADGNSVTLDKEITQDSVVKVLPKFTGG